MKRNIISLLFSLAIIFPSLAQNEAVPDYLTKQDFPDSVKNMSMMNLEEQQAPFAEIMKLYAGKKVVIDIWASWCGDCIAGLPKLKVLMEKTSNEKVEYVFISLDEDEKKWRSAINKFNIPGKHYMIKKGWKNPLANYIVLDWIPRYLVLNEKGQVIMPKSISANEQLEKLLLE